MEAKGKKYLKIVGILMIVFGGISVVISLLGLLGGGLIMAGNAAGEETMGALSGLLIVASLVSLLLAALQLVTGIIGVKNCEKPEKAALCLKLGITIIVVSLLSSVVTMFINGFSVTALISALVGLVLPALFCYGAKLNQQQ